MATLVKAVPTGYHTITPTLIVKDARAAIAFYKKAFGAEEKEVFTGPDGRVMHAEVKIGDSILMLSDEMPQRGCLSPTSLKGSSASLYLYVENADSLFERAVKAGAEVAMPMADMFWGDRWGQVSDPFGYKWSIATHKEDLTLDQMRKRSEQFFAAQAKVPQS